MVPKHRAAICWAALALAVMLAVFSNSVTGIDVSGPVEAGLPATLADTFQENVPALEGYPPKLELVQADTIIGRIRSDEPVEIDKAYVAGDLDLSRLDRPVRSSIVITNSTIEGEVIFEETVFEKGVDLRGTTFVGNTSFVDARFSGDSNFARTDFARGADFRGAKFDGLATFVGARFMDDAQFGYAQFAKFASFGNSLFNENADFSNAQFDEDAIFLGTSFKGYANFEYAQFTQLASFWNSAFGEDANFLYTQFGGTANFMNAGFGGNATFVGARCSKEVVFRSAVFEGDAVFGLANFDGFSDFSGSTFRGNAIFAVAKFADIAHFVDARFSKPLILESARIYTMQLNNATFGDGANINLRDADFTRLMVPWDSIKGRLIYDPAAYLALVKNYRNLEWRRDANDCYYHYRRLSQADEDFGFDKLIDVIAWVSCGYGVRPSYTVYWSIALILIFAGMYWQGNGIRKRIFEKDNEKTGDHRESGKDRAGKKRHISMTDALHYSAMMFTSQSPANLYAVDVYRNLAMVEGLIGWFLLGLFVVVLSGTLIR